MRDNRSLHSRVAKLEKASDPILRRDLRWLAEYGTEAARLDKLRDMWQRHGSGRFHRELTEEELIWLAGHEALDLLPEHAGDGPEWWEAAAKEQADSIVQTGLYAGAAVLRMKAERDPAGKTCQAYTGAGGQQCGRPAVAREQWRGWVCAEHAAGG